MLRHMNLHNYANLIENATFEVLKEGKHVTKDLKGNASTSEYTNAIMEKINNLI